MFCNYWYLGLLPIGLNSKRRCRYENPASRKPLGPAWIAIRQSPDGKLCTPLKNAFFDPDAIFCNLLLMRTLSAF